MDMPGVLVTFEGPDGGGKSTVIAEVGQRLADAGVPVTVTREPGGTDLGLALRRMLLTSGGGVSARAEVLLFAADRAQHVDDVIAPALQAGHVVLCDRYLDSSRVYQGVIAGHGLDWVTDVSLWAAGGVVPTLTVLLDVDPLTGLSRKARQGEVTVWEERGGDVQARVRAAFLDLAASDGPANGFGRRTWTVVDATQPRADVVDAAWAAVAAAVGLDSAVPRRQ